MPKEYPALDESFSFGLSIIVLILWWSTTIIISKPVSELNTSIERYLSTANPDSLLIAAIFLLATTIILWGWQKSAINKRAFIFLSSALLVGDLFYVGINYNSTFDPKFVFPETPSLAFLPTLTAKEPEPHRVLDVNSGLIVLGMTPELYQLQTLSGYTSWVLSRYSEYSYLTQSRFPTMKYVYFTDCCHDLIDAMNVKYVYTSHGTTLTDASPEIDLINALHKAELEVNIPEAVSNTFWTIENQEHPVLYQHPSTRITYELLLEKPARLITAIAIDPTRMGQAR